MFVECYNLNFTNSIIIICAFLSSKFCLILLFPSSSLSSFFVSFFLLDVHSSFYFQKGEKPGEEWGSVSKEGTIKRIIGKLLYEEREKRNEAKQVCLFS